jgi:hypothetical protein
MDTGSPSYDLFDYSYAYHGDGRIGNVSGYDTESIK